MRPLQKAKKSRRDAKAQRNRRENLFVHALREAFPGLVAVRPYWVLQCFCSSFYCARAIKSYFRTKIKVHRLL